MTTPKQNKEALGKGIRSLLQSIDSELKTPSSETHKPKIAEAATGVLRIAIDQIETNPKQPRHDFDEQSLKELAASIKTFDLIQPITVARLTTGKYRLISGERRYRAAKIAGMKDLPAYVRLANDGELLELALLENLQRQDLNAVEIALSYKRMMEELDYTQDQVAERMGKERSTVANYIRLLKLPPDIQYAVRQGTVSMGHARALINVDTVDKQLYIFHEIQDRDLSVRQTEELVRKLYKAAPAVKNGSKSALPPTFKKIEDNLASHFSTKVRMQHSKKGHGSITLEYYSLEELNKLLAQMGISAD